MPQFVKDVEEIRERASRKIEEGAVTESYRGDVKRTIAILNEALATEIVCVLRYMHHYFMATGVHGSSVANEFKEHADSEREHADAIAERIQQLGGKPDFNPKSLLERSASQYIEGETLGEMIKEDLIAERIVIEVYQEMIRHFANDDPTTRHMIEEILADEEEHASDLSDLLYIVDPATGETEGRDPGADPLNRERSNASQQAGKSGQKAGGREKAKGEDGGQQAVAMSHKQEGVVEEVEREQRNSRQSGSVKAQSGNDGREQGRKETSERAGSGNRGRESNQRDARGKKASSSASDEPARQPGGRTMNRRNDPRKEIDTEAAERANSGGMSGGTRRVAVTNKRNKKRAA